MSIQLKELNSGVSLVKSLPIQLLLNSQSIEKKLLDNLAKKSYPQMRIWAVANAIEDDNPEKFVQLLNLKDVSNDEKKKISQQLKKFQGIKRDYEIAKKTWEEVFWQENNTDQKRLIEVETARRNASNKYMKSYNLFSFLFKKHEIPAVDFCVPDPKDVLKRWKEYIKEPEKAYAPPKDLPKIEISQKVRGVLGNEYWIRFQSPSLHMKDLVYARVYEPEGITEDNHSLIMAGGLGDNMDLLNSSVTEVIYARAFNKFSCRVVTVEFPWHGRRTPKGYFSGEKYLATIPEGLAKLYTSQVQETSVIINWLKSNTKGRVGVGGLSLGGIVSQLIIGHCGSWDEKYRPNAGFLNATCNQIESVVINSTLAEALGTPRAVEGKGWSSEHLEKFGQVLNPPKAPGISPNNIIAVVGKMDNMMPYEYSIKMFEEWNIPKENISVLDTGHMGVAFTLYKDIPAKKMLVDLMNSLS